MARRGEKVVVAMSGGVDSSVTASLLLEQGYDVTGVFLCLGTVGSREVGSGTCCSPEDAADAHRVADALGIELFVLDVAESFEPIVEQFAAEYARGRTPNPCVSCNARVKLTRLVALADNLDAPYVATGHYARIVDGPGGTPAVGRARTRGKDQSYVLFAAPRAVLPKLLLPIGAFESKDEVREVARERGLAVHDKRDSQEICFVPDDDYSLVLAERAPEALRPGDIVHTSGRTLGRHQGYGRFTIGQRRGLGIGGGQPLYVIRVDAKTATVTVGSSEELLRDGLSASCANWHCDPPAEFDATVQVRYNHPGVPARVQITGDATFAVTFAEPEPAIAPGQAAVVYEGDRLVGGGWID